MTDKIKEQDHNQGSTITRLTQYIKISDILPGKYQPRQDNEVSGEFIDNIKKIGIIQPIAVLKVNGNYELLTGNQRFAGATKAGLTEIPAVIFEDLSQFQMAQLAWTENWHRTDLSYQEKATFCKKFKDEFNLIDKQLETELNIPHTTAVEMMSLLNLDPDIFEAISHPNANVDRQHNKDFTYSKAIKLARLSGKDNFNKETEQRALFTRITEDGMTRDNLAKLVNFIKEPIYKAQSDKLKDIILTNTHMTAELARLVSSLGSPIEKIANQSLPHFNKKEKIAIAEHICKNQLSLAKARNYVLKFIKKHNNNSDDLSEQNATNWRALLEKINELDDLLFNEMPHISSKPIESNETAYFLDSLNRHLNTARDFKDKISQAQRGGQSYDTIN